MHRWQVEPHKCGVKDRYEVVHLHEHHFAENDLRRAIVESVPIEGVPQTVLPRLGLTALPEDFLKAIKLSRRAGERGPCVIETA